MKLSEMLTNKSFRPVATDIPAISAITSGHGREPVAEIAEIAVATTQSEKTKHSGDVDLADQNRGIATAKTAIFATTSETRLKPSANHFNRAMPMEVRCIDCKHAEPTSHAAMIDCSARVQAPGNCGPYQWWMTDRHHCDKFECKSGS